MLSWNRYQAVPCKLHDDGDPYGPILGKCFPKKHEPWSEESFISVSPTTFL
jgi:hypothetical protein